MLVSYFYNDKPISVDLINTFLRKVRYDRSDHSNDKTCLSVCLLLSSIYPALDIC